jgi:hypothetical protein
MINPFLIIKKRFLARKAKKENEKEVVVNKPADQVKDEGKPFYHREPPREKRETLFYSQIEAKERRRRKIKTRMQKHSRRINREA